MLNGIDKPEEVALIYDLITDIADTEDEWEDLLASQLENWSVDAQTVKNVNKINQSGVGIINPLKGFGDIEKAMNSMFDEIKKGSLSPATAIETYQSKIDAAISDAENYDYNADMQAIKAAAEEAAAAE